MPWAGPLWAALVDAPKSEPVFSSGYRELVDNFARVSALLKVKVVPYQLRHNGPVGPPEAVPDPSGGAKERPMEEPDQPRPVRATREARVGDERGAGEHGRVLSHLRRLARGVHPSRAPSTTSAAHMKGTFFLDLFSGQEGVAKALRAAGFRCLEVDIRHGHDMRNGPFVSRLVQAVREGRVLGVMAAPPCESFSVARDRSGKIRSEERPEGLRGLGPGSG